MNPSQTWWNSTVLIALITMLGTSIPLLFAYLNRKLDNLGKVAESTHTFINYEKGVSLREKLVDKQRIAQFSTEEGDKLDLEKARMAVDEHMKAQGVVDSQKGTDAEKKGKG